jgi:hypothetical protein
VVTRTDAAEARQTVFVGYVSSVVPDGTGNMRVTASGPEGLVDRRTLKFSVPMLSASTAPDAFRFWWKQLDYVFGLPDPDSFPTLRTGLSADGRALAERYLNTAGALARSRVLNALGKGLTVREQGASGDFDVESRFIDKEIQVGFAGLLRQFDSKREPASFGRVCDALWLAASATEDGLRGDRLEQLARWREVVKRLNGKSLNQLLRDKMVAHGAEVLNYKEPDSPEFLLSAYAYGDLLHWDRQRTVVAAWEEDKFDGPDRRLAFLSAAAVLAHVYLGFAALIRAATDE